MQTARESQVFHRGIRRGCRQDYKQSDEYRAGVDEGRYSPWKICSGMRTAQEWRETDLSLSGVTTMAKPFIWRYGK